MKKPIVFFLAILFAACSSAPQVTVTSEVTVTLTPIPTKTPTQEAALPAEVVELQEKLGDDYKITKGEGDFFVIVDTKTELPVPEVTISEDGTTWTRTYQFENADGEISELTVDGYTKHLNVVRSEETTQIDFSGWKVTGGQWVREKVISPEGTETKYPKYSVDEVVTMLILDGEKVTEENWEEPASETRSSSKVKARELLGLDKYNDILFQEMKFPDIGSYVYSSRIIINGTERSTIFYTYINLRGNAQSLVIWKLNGIKRSFIVDANLGGDVKPLTISNETLK